MIEKLKNKYQAFKNWYNGLSKKRKIIVSVLVGGKILIDVSFFVFCYFYFIR